MDTNRSRLVRAALMLGLLVVGLLPLATSAQHTCVPPPSGLVGWWRGEGNGNDSAGGNNAYALPNVHFTAGVVGEAFAFDPENLPFGTYAGVQIADQPAYALTNSLSVEGWIRPRGDGYVVFYRGDNRIGLDPYTLGMGDNNMLGFGITDANGNTASVTAPLVYNQWWYVAATLEGGSGKLRLYTNGVLAAQITTTIRPFGNLIPQDSPGIGIGNVNDGFNNFPFRGDIDEISLYNRALSSAEIAAIYNAGSAGKCQEPANHAPVAQCTNVIVSASANCIADASVNNGSFDPDGDPITVLQVPPGPYPLGTNLVTLIVADNHGASNSCSALVIILDKTPPTLNCPGGQVLEFQDEKGAIATYSVTATDTCSTASLVVTPPSGSLFPIGVTPVHARAVDGSGNSAQCTFDVTVLGAQGVKSNVLAQLTALRSSVVLPEPLAHKFNDAMQHLADSLNPACWIDQTHLQLKGGNTAMNEEKLAVSKLHEIMESKKCPVDPAVLQGFIGRIVKCDRLLAVISIQDAAKAGPKATRIAQALALVAKGDAEAVMGHYANAIEQYRKAWRQMLHLRLQVALNPDGTTEVQFVGDSGKTYRIEASTDLVHWVSLGACTADGDGNIEFTDPTAAQQPARFYRAVQQ